MRRPRLFTTLAAAALAAITGLSGASPAAAITGGTEDTQNRYSTVGMIVFYDGTGGRFRCSATLMTPTVLLTAAHCTDGTVGKTIVNFSWEIARQAPSGLPVADPAVGYTGSVVDAQNRTWLAGTAHTHPNYSNFTDTRNWNDVGVVVLDSPVTGVATSRLAPGGYLDRFAQPALNKTLVTLVGYGTEVRKADSGPQTPTPQSFPIVRRYTDEVGQKLTPQILQTNGNDKDNRGGGGSCFGDSGGPSFKDGRVVTVTSYGYTNNCRYLGGLQRVDIPVVQGWLAGFGVTP
ncbi:MAG: trypsin-like serine protease [Kineosporiaceae bacterium]|nr:trypsin-like serine protease [Kineosporiaceae bacterium]